MQTQKKAVIIGAGVGGIATAAFLAKAGYKVDVYEKNANPGGRCGQMIEQGHRFDLGATILLMPSLYRKVFKALDMDLDKELETTSLEPVYKIFFGNGNRFSFTRDHKKMKAQLEAIEPGSYRKFNEYVTEGYRFFDLAMNDLLGKNFYRFFEFVNLKSLRILIRLKTWMFHTEFIKRYFKDPQLRMAFTFQNIYVGQSPYQAPAFFSMLPAAEIAEGALFPKGGMHKVVEKLLDKAIEHGARFHYKSPIAQIVVKECKSEGVLLEDGTMIEADVVIANADLPYVYKELLPDRAASDKLKKKKYSCSAIVFHWGLDKVYPQLDHHTIFLNEPYKEGLDKIFKEKSLSDTPSFYIHAPVRTDQSAAPEGHDTLSVIVPVANLDSKADQDWKALKKRARQGVINRLKQAGMEDIEDHIKLEICYLPKTWKKRCNVTRGSVFGSLGHTIFQMGYFRPHNCHPNYKNLYFAGGSTHPGNGIPLVLLSAKLTSERILKEASQQIDLER